MAAMLALPSQAQASSVARPASASVTTADVTDSPSPTDTPTDAPTATDSPTPTDAPSVTDAPTATDSPSPTDAPTPTPTPTPTGPEPTRIVLDTAKVNSAHVGAAQKITGILQAQAADGTWGPVNDAPLTLFVSGSGYDDSTWTTSAGRFTFTENVPATATSWTVSTAAYMSTDYAASSAVFRIASVLQQTTLSLSDPTIDEYSNLSFYMETYSTNGTLVGGKVYLLQSPNGKTGWTNLGYIKANGRTDAEEGAYVDNPHGYWKLYYAGAPGYSLAYSNVIHTFRYETKITGGKPNHTTVRKNATVTFTGTLDRRSYGAWGAVKSATVTIIFRPYKSKTWYLMKTGKTSSSGKFSISVKDPESGTWEALFMNPGSSYVVSGGPETYIHA
jgi:hypothetical protein